MKETYLTITAAAADEKKPAKVKGVAYTGGKMRLGGWGDHVVVDLEGLEVPAEVPLLVDHYNTVYARVGVIEATVKEGSLHIEGEIVADGEDAANIVKQAKAGADWQLSIGAEVNDYIFVEEGSATINGQAIEAPFYHVKAATLREVSVVACGADKNTRMRVTAAAHLTNKLEKNQMTEEEIKAAAAASERDRVLAIKAVCAGECPEIEAQAIANGETVETVTKKMLAHVRASRPVSTPNVIVKDSPKISAKTIEAALSMRGGMDEATAAKEYGEQTIEAAADYRDLSLKQVLEASLAIDGRPVHGSFGNDTIRAAFSTVSLPGILGNVANKALLTAYKAQNIIATKLCREGDLADFKTAERYRLTDVGDLQPLAPGGEIVHGSIAEEKATNQLETYAKMFSLTRQMIVNDDLGAFLQVPTAMGTRAARLIDQLFFKRLMSNPAQADGAALFAEKHGNLLSGSTSALSADALKKAIALFLDQVDVDGQPIAVEPKYLVVPTALKYDALELCNSAGMLITGSADKVRPAMNAIAMDGLQVIASPYLSNVNYTGNSATAWYLFGQPGVVDTFEIGYLRGKRVPTVEAADTDFNTLGMQWRVFFDLGIREIDHRGMVKAAGI